MLRLTKRSRIFQDRSVPEIVATILRDAGIAVRLALGRSHPRRAYCTQYEETDYEFVRRLVAEAGLYFYFYAGRSANGEAGVSALASAATGDLGTLGATLVSGDSVVFADDPAFYPAVAGDDRERLVALTAAAMGGQLDSTVAIGVTRAALAAEQNAFRVAFVARDFGGSPYDEIRAFAVANQALPSRAMFRDYDPDRPTVRLQSVAASTEPFEPGAGDIVAAAVAASMNAASAASIVQGESDVRSGIATTTHSTAERIRATVTDSAAIARNQVYEHHSPFLFPKWETAKDEAPLLLRQHRRRASVARGEGACHDFAVGHCFEVDGHPVASLDTSWVLTKVTHVGNVSNSAEEPSYVSKFECVPANMLYAPKRPPRTTVQAALTATVVGPAGEEIFTDDKGRIKLQFHWDREGAFNGNSSCWIRPMQAWAGTGWGHQFIPRIGMEVVVVFDGGDPDKPIVLGSQYNGTHPCPFPLPGDKTRSGVRTQSSPGGDGFNELSFEDRKDNEEIFVHGQRNLREVVRNDRLGGENFVVHNQFVSDFFHELLAPEPPMPTTK